MRTCLLIAAVVGLCAGARAEDNAPPARKPLRVVAFYSSTCQHCYKAKKALADSRKRWGNRIRVEHRDMKDLKPFVQMLAYDEHYGAKAQAPPKVFVGGQFLEGYPAIAKRLEAVITEELAKGAVTFEPAAGTAREARPLRGRDQPHLPAGQAGQELDVVERRFETFGPGAVAAAGLLDGVNPCAFTTIVFLLSMLAHLGKSRRELAVVGVGFTAAVFATYFLLGLGIWGVLEGIKAYSVGSGISTALAYGVACLTLATAAGSGGFLSLAGWRAGRHSGCVVRTGSAGRRRADRGSSPATRLCHVCAGRAVLPRATQEHGCCATVATTIEP